MGKKEQMIEMIKAELKDGPLVSLWMTEDGYEGYIIRQDGVFRGVEEAIETGNIEDLELRTLSKILGNSGRLEESDYFKEMLQLPIIQFLQEWPENRTSKFNGRLYFFAQEY